MKQLLLILLILFPLCAQEYENDALPPVEYDVDTLTMYGEQYVLKAKDNHNRYTMKLYQLKNDSMYTIIHGWFNFISGPECDSDSCYDSVEVFSINGNEQPPYVIAQKVMIQNQLLYRFCVMDSCCLNGHSIAHYGEALTQTGAYAGVKREQFVLAEPNNFYPDGSSFKGDGETIVHSISLELIKVDGDSIPQVKQYRDYWNGKKIVREELPQP